MLKQGWAKKVNLREMLTIGWIKKFLQQNLVYDKERCVGLPHKLIKQLSQQGTMYLPNRKHISWHIFIEPNMKIFGGSCFADV